MTAPAKPTISYGHGFLDDCTETTVPNWDKTESHITLSDIQVFHDDMFSIYGLPTGEDPYGYWMNDTPLGLLTDIYKKIRIRYKSDGTQLAKFVAVFHDATTQPLLTAGNSPYWKTFVVSLTAAKTLDYIQLGVTWLGTIYVDFVLVYKNDFTLPNTDMGKTFVPACRFVRPAPPGMSGAETENLGSELAEVTMNCELDIGTWTRVGDTLPGEVFLDIDHNSKTEDFQWLELGDLLVKFKATLDKPAFNADVQGSAAKKVLSLTLYEYRRAPANDETYAERFGLI